MFRDADALVFVEKTFPQVRNIEYYMVNCQAIYLSESLCILNLLPPAQPVSCAHMPVRCMCVFAPQSQPFPSRQVMRGLSYCSKTMKGWQKLMRATQSRLIVQYGPSLNAIR